MLNSRQNFGDLERLESGAVIDPIHFQTNVGQLFDDLFQRRIGFKVILEPGKCELHLLILSCLYALKPPNSVGMSRGRKP